MANDKPFTVEEQIDTMKKYVTFTKRARMRDFLQYSEYFRASRYGKYLLSYTNVFAMKPSQDDVARKILEFCRTARTKREISEYIGYKNLTYMIRIFLKPLLENGKLLYTIPEKPQSRLQKYITR